MASHDFGDEDELDTEYFLRRFYDAEGSIRGLSRATGIAYSTLRDVLKGVTRAPSQRTLDRLERAYEATPVIRRERTKTDADDSILWTTSKLANLVPPRGAVKFQIIGVGDVITGRTASTPYIDLETHSPLDYLDEKEFSARVVQRIVWAFGRDR